MNEEHLRQVINEITIATAKSVSGLYEAFAKKHCLTEHECRLVFGEAMLRNAAMNLAAVLNADGDGMIRLVKALQSAHKRWQDDERSGGV